MKVIVQNHAASDRGTPAETKKERTVRWPICWEQFCPAGPHGEDFHTLRRDQAAHGVRRHSLTVVFRAR